MDSLPSPFTIEIDGKPIAQIKDSAEDKTQAILGSEAAVFNLKDGKLVSGQWLLARNLTEDRSLLPKKVAWYKKNVENEGIIKPVSAKKEGDSYELFFESESSQFE